MSERIVLDALPMKLTASEFMALLPQEAGSLEAFAEMIEEDIDIINATARPKAVLRWIDIDSVEGDTTTLEGTQIKSRIVSEKFKPYKRAFLCVITIGNEFMECADFSLDMLKDFYAGALIRHACSEVFARLETDFGMKDIAMLQPGSLPDWPIEENRKVFELISNVEGDTGVRILESGYMEPWNSVSGILFPDGDGYRNCNLCLKLDCVGRMAPFDQTEYDRIFG